MSWSTPSTPSSGRSRHGCGFGRVTVVRAPLRAMHSDVTAGLAGRGSLAILVIAETDEMVDADELTRRGPRPHARRPSQPERDKRKSEATDCGQRASSWRGHGREFRHRMVSIWDRLRRAGQERAARRRCSVTLGNG